MSKPQFAILRFAKYKGPEISNIEAHNERTKDEYASNPDIDKSRSCLNFHLLEPEHKYRAEAERQIKDAGCRTRSDSVRLVEALVTATPYGRENAPYAPLLCPADGGRATQRQRNCRQQEETDAVAGQVLGAYGQEISRSGARRKRQRNRTRPYPAAAVQGDDPPDQAEGQAGRIAFRRQCVQCQGESSRCTRH